MGSVRSVFAAAINIHRKDGLVVSLVRDESAMTDMSVAVPALFAARRGSSCAIGNPVASAGGMLRIGETLRVGTIGSARWSGALPFRASCRLLPDAAAAMLPCLAAAGDPLGLLGVLVPDAAGAASRAGGRILAAAAARPGQGGRRIRGLSGLVGLGPGLTPSGDDFLAGVILAECMVRGARIPVDREEIAASLDRTTPEGRTLLTLALENRFPAYLLHFALEAAEPRSSTVQDACSHGGTSGTDALTGFYWYLSRAPGSAP
jgi:hypothetical protein